MSFVATWLWVPEKPEGRADHLIVEALKNNWGEWNVEDPPSISRTQLKRLIESGLVRVNGVTIKCNSTLSEGVTVELNTLPVESVDVEPEDIPIEILYEDSHIAIVNKPAGMLTHPTRTESNGTLVNCLLFRLKDLSGIGGKMRPGIVHRLDRETAGLLVVSKNDESHQKLTQQFSEHTIERRYWALCYGCPHSKENFIINEPIGRNEAHRTKMDINRKNGKPAVTKVHALKQFCEKDQAFASLIEAQLETGRTHQVRVHLTHIGNSLLGDPTYGKPTSRQKKWMALPKSIQAEVNSLRGQALYARVLGFSHPITKQDLRFEIDPPPHLSNLIKILEPYKNDHF